MQVFQPDGDVYVADLGNQRVQVFSVTGTGSLVPKTAWPVEAWKNIDPLYKSYICVLGSRVFITDSEAGAVLEYTKSGSYLRSYIPSSTGTLNYGLLYGIAPGGDGSLWVSDLTGGAGVLVKILPEK